MRGTFIIAEGPTEEGIINESLAPYLQAQGIYEVVPIVMQTSKGHKGGAINYDRFKFNVNNLLLRDPGMLVTSLLDFYKIPANFPEYKISMQSPHVIDKVSGLEESVNRDINHARFLTYIQLHEVEGLLLCDKGAFDTYYPNMRDAHQRELEAILAQYPNPELINDGEHSHPHKRLKSIIPSYKKTFDGPMLALEHGMDLIMEKCPRFRNWVETIIQKVDSP